MQLIAKLWSRSALPWLEEALDLRSSSLPGVLEGGTAGNAGGDHKHRIGKPRVLQAQVYEQWKEASVEDWLKKL